jgi:hypothetical protein
MRLSARYASQLSKNYEYNKILGWNQGQVGQMCQNFQERLPVSIIEVLIRLDTQFTPFTCRHKVLCEVDLVLSRFRALMT